MMPATFRECLSVTRAVSRRGFIAQLLAAFGLWRVCQPKRDAPVPIYCAACYFAPLPSTVEVVGPVEFPDPETLARNVEWFRTVKPFTVRKTWEPIE